MKKHVVTKEDGTYRMDEVPKGSYSMRVRRIGYAPQVKGVEVGEQGATVDFSLVPWPYAMPTIVTVAERAGISGTVADTAFEGVPDARVILLGKNLAVHTDSSGVFILPAPPGQYMLSMDKAGYSTRVVGITVPQTGGRQVSMVLYPAHAVRAEESWNVRDFVDRQNNRNAIKEPFYTREDITTLGFEWIHDLVVIASSSQASDACQAIVNGGPATAPLNTLRADDVESVEIYDTKKYATAHAARGATSIVAGGSGTRTYSTKPSVVRTNNRNASILNQSESLNCPTVYVWLR